MAGTPGWLWRGTVTLKQDGANALAQRQLTSVQPAGGIVPYVVATGQRPIAECQILEREAMLQRIRLDGERTELFSDL